MTLTVIPSDNVAENQSVALQCESNPNPPTPIVVSFIIRLPPINPVCVRWSQAMEFGKKHQILVGSRITPPVHTLYKIQFAVSRNLNGMSVFCQTRYNLAKVSFFHEWYINKQIVTTDRYSIIKTKKKKILL